MRLLMTHCGAGLLPLSSSDNAVVIEVKRIKACERLRFELLQA